MKFNIVLVEPEIPQNTGNIARTCSATGSTLHLVRPLGFEVTDKQLKRAGLDYWHLLDIRYYDSIEEVLQFFTGDNFYFMSTKGKINLSQLVIVSKYFNSITDYENIEMACPKFQGLCEMLHFNPISVDEETRLLFPNIQTLHLYNENNDGNIGFMLFNHGKNPYEIKAGDKIGHIYFFKFLTVDNEEEITTERKGGFGSTNK